MTTRIPSLTFVVIYAVAIPVLMGAAIWLVLMIRRGYGSPTLLGAAVACAILAIISLWRLRLYLRIRKQAHAAAVERAASGAVD